MSARTKKKAGFWNLTEELEGDKIIWMIVFMLIMFSILAISSSTSLLAIQQKSSRISIAMEQVIMSVAGLGIIGVFYKFGNVGLFRLVSRYGFAISFFMLAFLASHFQGIPFFKPVSINKAWRCISIFGFQLHVFEFVKVLMIMYIAWAMDAIKTGRTEIADELGKMNHLKWLKTDMGKKFFYVVGPIIVTVMMLALGSNSSAMFIGLVMIATALIGGLDMKYIASLGILAVVGAGAIYGTYKLSGGHVFQRLGLVVDRLALASNDPLEKLHNAKVGTLEFQEILDKTRQPVSAKVAVSEGGFFGKGPGKSTQRYIVSVMYEDYMFSFIVEEYGIIGAILVLMLYGSLLARGSIIVRNCENHYAKTLVAGMVLLVSGQALMHMFINVDLGPLTGQTLPMISHGNSSLLAFSMVFGIILCISKMAKKKIAQETAKAEPIIVTQDEVKDSLNDLDALEEL